MPGTGTATFTGLASGFYVDNLGIPYFTAANMSANADFGARTIGFSTTNSTMSDLNTGAGPMSATGLNLSGTLTYTSGSSRFTGSVTSVNGMSGNANGRFYGPNAEEIGGVYGVAATGVGSMLGAFGGRRP